MLEELYIDADDKIQKAVQTLGTELSRVRSGRATTALFDKIIVEAYGASMPLNQVATVNVADATSILIRPFDKNNLAAIEKAILASDLGLTPQSDGTIIRINIPPLTEERRKEMVKMIKQMVEDGKVHVRNIRRDAIEKIKKLEKKGDVSKDNSRDAQAEMQKLTDKGTEELDVIFKKKEEEIITI